MVSTGMKIVKYLLFVFNFIFWVTGIAIITVGAIIISNFSKYVAFLDHQVSEAVPIILIVAGCIVTIIAFFGCCGAIRESYCMIMTFAVLLGIIFVLELAAAIAAYVQKGKVTEEIVAGSMNKTLIKYNPEDQETVKIWDAIQHDLKCCGVEGYSDWSRNQHLGTGNVPQSCCKIDGEDCGKGGLIHPDKIYTKGCFRTVYEEIIKNSVIVAGVSLGIALIEIVGIVFACMLARAIKREYEIV